MPKPKPKRKPAATRPQPKTAKTVAAVAAHFGVSQRAVGYWLSSGAPGSPGRYDLAAIAAWREGQQSNGDEPAEGARGRFLAARAAREELRLAKERGELVRLDDTRRLMIRHINEAKAILGQLPDRVLAVLPAAIAGKIRRQVRDECARLIDHSCGSLADLLAKPAEP
jgi:hypothetical protein